MAGRIESVLEDSIAGELGLEAGDEVIAVNGHTLQDLIDYNFHTADENILLKVKKQNGETIIFDIEHDEDEDLGIVFDADTFDGIRLCRNNCLFCFVAQLPEHCRASMNVKDDDYRMSFMEGSYITGTNLDESDLQRIKEMHLSPLYISIHTTDPELRVKLLKNPKAAEIMQLLQRLKNDDIYFHGQLVLCPGFNDGDALRKTIEELLPFLPHILSLALVPVGLTAFQKNPEMRLFSPEEASNVIAIAEEYQKQLGGNNFIYIADEFYLIAGKIFPEAEHYNDFCQIENGVGMSAAFYDEWQLAKEDLPAKLSKPTHINLITGISGAAVLQPVIDELNNIPNLNIELFPITNSFFGETVTVTGLVTGSCILKAMGEWRARQSTRPQLVIPSVMLKFDAPVFLDDMTVDELSEKLDADIRVIENGAFALVDLVLEED